LQGVEEVDYLSQGRSQVTGRSAFDFGRDAAEAAQQQVLQIPAATVGRQHTQVVDMEIARGVSALYFGRIDLMEPVASIDRRSYIEIEPLE
jgi:hypothetical protein